MGICPMKRSIEEKTRKSLFFVRLAQNILSPSISNRLLKTAVKHYQCTGGVSRESIMANGVPCEWIIPQEITTKGVMLYIHGGGFVIGLTPNHLQMAANLAGKMKIRILMIDYRLAPQYPFPAAVDDCVSVYKWILAQGIVAKDIVIAGDSAGGNLTITSMIKLRELNIPLPSAGACLSPVVDLTPQANYIEGYKDPLLPPRAAKFYNDSYVGNADAENPLISPVFANFDNLPPLLIHIGEDEVLRDNAVKFSELARKAGADVTCKVYPGMWHVWQLYEKLPQTAQSLDEIADFLASRLSAA